MNSKMERRILMQFVITYLSVITLVFATIGSYAYITIIHNNRLLAQNKVQQQLEQQANETNASIDNINLLMNSFYYNKDMVDVASFTYPVNQTSYPKYNDFVRQLFSSVVVNEFIDEIVVYFHRSDSFVSSTTAGLWAETYYNAYLLQDMGNDLEQFKNISRSHSPGEIFTINNEGSNIIFIGFDMLFGVNKKATFLVKVNASKILGEYADEINSYYEIILSDNTIITKGNHSKTVDYYLFKGSVNSINAQYNVFVPRNELYHTDLYLKMSLITLYILVMAAAIALAYYFSRRTAKPVAKMLGYTRAEGDVANGNSLDRISTVFETVVASRDALTEKITAVNNNLLQTFVYGLLRGDDVTDNDLDLLPYSIKTLIAHQAYTAALLLFHEQEINYISDELGISLQLLNKLDQVHAYQVSPARIELFICHDETVTPELVQTICGNILMEIYSNITSRPRLCTGSTVESANQIHISRCQAYVMSYNLDWSEEKGLLLFDPKLLNRKEPIFSLDDERHILRNILNGNIDAAKEVVRKLHDNLVQHSGSKSQTDAELSSALAFAMRRIIDRIAFLPTDAIMKIDTNIWKMHRTASFARVVEYFNTALDIISENVIIHKKTQNTRLLNRIDKYVLDNYKNCELSISSIAEAVMLTEGYVSAFYKQQTGESLSFCIERYRMQEAARLTRNTNLISQEIAKCTGYFNMNTYYKAFKRFHGISPKEYRFEATER